MRRESIRRKVYYIVYCYYTILIYHYCHLERGEGEEDDPRGDEGKHPEKGRCRRVEGAREAEPRKVCGPDRVEVGGCWGVSGGVGTSRVGSITTSTTSTTRSYHPVEGRPWRLESVGENEPQEGWGERVEVGGVEGRLVKSIIDS